MVEELRERERLGHTSVNLIVEQALQSLLRTQALWWLKLPVGFRHLTSILLVAQIEFLHTVGGFGVLLRVHAALL